MQGRCFADHEASCRLGVGGLVTELDHELKQLYWGEIKLQGAPNTTLLGS